jgi:hypothetical protein
MLKFCGVTGKTWDESWGSYGDVYDIGVVLCFGAAWGRSLRPTFRRNTLSPSSGLKWQGCEVEDLNRIRVTGSLSLSLLSSNPLLPHFSPEDGDSMFLRNVGIDLPNHTARLQNTRQHNLYSPPNFIKTIYCNTWRKQVWVGLKARQHLRDILLYIKLITSIRRPASVTGKIN